MEFKTSPKHRGVFKTPRGFAEPHSGFKTPPKHRGVFKTLRGSQESSENPDQMNCLLVQREWQ